MSKKVKWTQRAKASLNTYCAHIAADSPSSAERVRQTITTTSRLLSQNPNLFQLDEYYPDNPGNIRRFFKWSYKVVYLVEEDEVIILEIYHTSQFPKKIS
ncbi:MAG: type II toxin-antitoxin system RelE/ParE family toxin [Cyclobacteriaceae bacterium]